MPELYINRFVVGLYDMRSPLVAPTSAMGLNVIQRNDTLWDGLNIDNTHYMTLQRRCGFLRYCSTAFGSSEYPQKFFTFKDTSGTIKAMVETPTEVAWFDTGSINNVITKTTTAQGSFVKVADTLYYCNGTDLKKWTGGVVSNWGIVPPATAPTITTVTGGSLSPTSGYTYVYLFMNSSTGHVSTASPTSANTLPASSVNFTVSGAGSTDPQVDQIGIYRTDDGGSVYYYLATIANATTWTYTDSSPDTSLNTDIVAPVADENNPPPAGMNLCCFYLGYVWGAVGGLLYFGGGPSVTNGVPEEAWPPANVFRLPGTITAFAPTSQGLIVFTQDDAYVVLGSDIISFRPVLWQKNFGVQSQNCLSHDGDLIFAFTSKSQLYSISGSSLSEIGFPIQGRLGAFNPTSTYLALHRSGVDEGLFISNGTDTMYRYSMTTNSWSTKYQPVGGVHCISSMEVTTTNYRLMLGRPTGSGYILQRDTATFTDDGRTYPASVTIGSIVVGQPRQAINVNAILVDTKAIGTYPTVGILMNEISGTFVTLPNPVQDPWELPASSTLKMMRHDLLGNQVGMPLLARHFQLQLTWPSEAAANELLGIGIV